MSETLLIPDRSNIEFYNSESGDMPEVLANLYPSITKSARRILDFHNQVYGSIDEIRSFPNILVLEGETYQKYADSAGFDSKSHLGVYNANSNTVYLSDQLPKKGIHFQDLVVIEELLHAVTSEVQIAEGQRDLFEIRSGFIRGFYSSDDPGFAQRIGVQSPDMIRVGLCASLVSIEGSSVNEKTDSSAELEFTEKAIRVLKDHFVNGIERNNHKYFNLYRAVYEGVLDDSNMEEISKLYREMYMRSVWGM